VNQLLKQARNGVKKVINESPENILIVRQPMTDDGFGNQVPDPFGTPTEHNYKVRISHERGNPSILTDTSAGMSTNLQRFIMADYQADIEYGDVFEAIGRSWKIGPVDPLKKFGGIIGYQAPLTDASAAVQTPEEEE
jgi:hypothetical protein